jgi:hypothetical protein
MNEHLSEKNIQLFVESPEQLSESLRKHVEVCHACQEKVKLYISLYKGLSEIESPIVPDYFAERVLEKIDVVQRKYGFEKGRLPLIYAFLSAILFLIPVVFKNANTNFFPDSNFQTNSIIILAFLSIVFVINKLIGQLNAKEEWLGDITL